MGRFPGGGTYLNFPGFPKEGERLLRDSYGPNYDRLLALKEKYDPSTCSRETGAFGRMGAARPASARSPGCDAGQPIQQAAALA